MEAHTDAIGYIKMLVADYFSITTEELISHKRPLPYVKPRQIAMKMCRDLTQESLSTIGRRLGNRDHTTIMHGCKAVNEMKMDSPELYAVYIYLKARGAKWIRENQQEESVGLLGGFRYLRATNVACKFDIRGSEWMLTPREAEAVNKAVNHPNANPVKGAKKKQRNAIARKMKTTDYAAA